jgi:hypothetical protein
MRSLFSSPSLFIFSPILVTNPSHSYLLFPAFFTTLYYHTLYAVPWIFTPLAFYGADFLVRFLRWRVMVGRVEGRAGVLVW